MALVVWVLTVLRPRSEQDGQTALMYASANGYTDAMEVLLKAGANLEGKDKFGFTALHVAATTGENEAIKLLLQSGAKVDARDKFGNIALKKAREQKHPEAAKTLEDFMQTGQLPPAESAGSKRPAPESTDEGEQEPSKKGKAVASASGESAGELATVAQSIATHLARAREHAQLARTVLISFSEAGGDAHALAALISKPDMAILVATDPRRQQ